ncbi:MAG: SDR family oxidoreductase, partial [Victivallales bacterium]
MAKKVFMTGSTEFSGKEVIVLTGGTGFLGRNWIPKILESNPDCGLYIISRTSSKDKLSGVLQDKRVKLIEGDVLNPNVINHDSDKNYLKDKITRFYHTVSSTSFFERERKQTFETNVAGTERVIKFLEQCPNLKKFIYISTAYTKNGLQAKTAKEDFIPERQIAGNPYEESK